MKINQQIAVTTILTSLLLSAENGLYAQMSTAGGFRVSETGSAVYEIPIKVPPGVAGMEPKLSLVYNSQSGNGLLGVGWSLQGLSSITRCPRTMAQDGVRGGVNYDTNDRYCLDGQRLMAISGTYGADGTEYRTERESFTKVISYGTAGNGPSYFKAWTKSGQIIEYGNTADSKIEAQGKSTVRVWALNKIQDTKGNYLSTSYIENNADGGYYVSRIDYTANAVASLTADQSVRFSYEGRSDTNTQFIAGAAVKTTVRLTNVKAYIGSVVTVDYRLNYQQQATNSRPHINSVTECDGNNICKAAIGLSVNAETLGLVSAPAFELPTVLTYDPVGRASELVDLNGDGLPDYVWRRWYLENGAAIVQSGAKINSGSGWINAPQFEMPYILTADGIGKMAEFVDLNGDGLPDFVWKRYYISGGVAYTNSGAYLNTGNGWASATQFELPYLLTADGLGKFGEFVDLNGDGLMDYVWRRWYLENGVAVVQSGAKLNSGNGWVNAPQFELPYILTADGIGKMAEFVDLNGDGLPDFVWKRYYTSGGVEYTNSGAYLNTGSGWVSSSQYALPGLLTGDGMGKFAEFVDLNGDGLPDYVWNRYYPGGGSSGAYLNTGNGWVSASQYALPGLLTGDNMGKFAEFVDFNGDGLPDFVWRRYYISGGVEYTSSGNYLNTGNGWVSTSQYALPWLLTADGIVKFGEFADLNGDGLPDYLWYRVYNQSGTLVTQKGAYINSNASVRVSNMSSGIGAGTTISYKSLTDKTIYAKDASWTFPARNLQVPFYVVSSNTVSNGIGGSIQTNYAYNGLKAELGTGRGLLGFKQVDATDVSTGVKGQTQYRQDWPYVGLPSQSKRIAPDGTTILSQTDFTYTCTNPTSGTSCTVVAGNRYFPYALQTDETSRDLNNTFISKVRTTSTYDALGNATVIGVTHLDAGGSSLGYSKTTTNTYTNDTANWLLGRLIQSQVQSTTP